ncbi:MAG TPA: rod shape-determining protein, partial [Blastocatellia bacterium]|nr:rod shape-determining protein [Blastocatellia bacterium]
NAIAAAIRAILPNTDPYGNMVVDIGGGTTDIAVISLSGIVYSRAVRVAGNELDEYIIQYIKRKYNLLIGERTAEQVKMQLGSAYTLDEPISMEIKGRNLIEGVPRTITITDEEVREALSDPIVTIVNAVRVALERTPPELSADIAERGIVLTGGGALLKSLDRRLMHETGVPVTLAENPLSSVVLGTGKMLDDVNLLDRVCLENTVLHHS